MIIKVFAAVFLVAAVAVWWQLYRRRSLPPAVDRQILSVSVLSPEGLLKREEELLYIQAWFLIEEAVRDRPGYLRGLADAAGIPLSHLLDPGVMTIRDLAAVGIVLGLCWRFEAQEMGVVRGRSFTGGGGA